MSDWQRIIKEESIATLEKLADKFGHDVIDVEHLSTEITAPPPGARPRRGEATPWEGRRPVDVGRA